MAQMVMIVECDSETGEIKFLQSGCPENDKELHEMVNTWAVPAGSEEPGNKTKEVIVLPVIMFA